MMRRRSAIVAFLAAAPAALSVLSAGAVGVPPTPRVEAISATGYRVHLSFGEPRVIRGEVFGFALAEVLLPGAEPEMSPGFPPLPARTVFLRVPWGVEASVSATPGAVRSLGALRPAPFAGLIEEPTVQRNLGAAEIAAALSGAEFTGFRNAGERGSGIATTRDMAAGDERLLAVTLRPVAWNLATGEAGCLEGVTLDVRWDRAVNAAGESGTGRGGGLTPAGAVGPLYTLRMAAGQAGVSSTPRTVPGRVAPGPVGSKSAAFGQATPGPFRVEPSRPWVRLGVLRPGLYQISSTDLAAAGVPVASIDPGTFRVFRATPGDIPENVDVDLGPDSLRECAIEVTGAIDTAFDPADRIFVYATGATGFGSDLALGGGSEFQETQHSDLETLWLTWGPGPTPGPPRRIAARDAFPRTVGAPILSAVTHRVHYEENRLPKFNLFRPPFRWERWFYRQINQGSRPPFFIQPPGALPGGATDLRVRMWGLGNSLGAGLPDHVARIYWNRALVDTAGWELSEPADIVVEGLATGAQDTLEIEVPILIDPPFPRNDISYLAWFELGYPRRLAATNDSLQFTAPDSMVAGRVQYAITAVSDSAAAWLLDRTDPENPVRLIAGSWAGSAPNFGLTVEDSVGPAHRLRYSLVSTARAPRPFSISVYAPASSPRTISDLLDPGPGNGADYLIVAPSAFLAAAESLAAYRSLRLSGIPSPRGRIATMDRIFSQFGSGRPSPVAIRNFMLHASRHWSLAPLYLCLLGDATLDPKNYLGFGVQDLVPTYSNYYDQSLFHQFTSDDFYALLDGPGDQLVDLVVGRLPAGNSAESMSLVAGKRKTYEEAADFDSWRTRAILCADDATEREQPDPLKNDHVQQMERKDGLHIPFPVERAKVYLNDFAFADTTHQSKPAAREEFIAQINRGAWLTEYVGHGSDDVLAHEHVFTSSDISGLTNAARPSVFGFFSCTVGKFDDLGREGLAELLLDFPSGGAAGALAASDEAFGNRSTALNDSFMDELFPLYPRVDSLRTAGLAFARAKNGNVNTSVRKYGFLGDPALRPPLPRGRGIWEKAPLDSLQRGEVVFLRGHALMPDSSTDTLSMGTVQLLVQGPPFVRTQIATQSGERQTYRVPGPTLYRGEVSLNAGSFEARFVVPVDGRVAGSGAQLRALLSAAGGQGVGLAVDSVRIAVGESGRIDATPPMIGIVYPAGSDSILQPGGRTTFVITDSSGIDLTRLDNAHTIFVIVDDRGAPIEITPRFVYGPDSYTGGSVEFSLPSLSDGAHWLEVHASDNFRNIGVQRFLVDVANVIGSETAIVLDQVFNYPNPFPQETLVHARLSQPARITIQILTVAGRRVREVRVDGKAGENYIPWDGRDSMGEKVAIGVYLFKVTAELPSGGRATAIGRALRTE